MGCGGRSKEMVWKRGGKVVLDKGFVIISAVAFFDEVIVVLGNLVVNLYLSIWVAI